MTLHELDSPSSVETFKSTNPNTLLCFSATWCGPCQRSKPQLEQLAKSYQSDPTINLTVGIVYEHALGDAVSTTYGITGFPTYVLWCQNGMVEKGRVVGPMFDDIKKMVEDAGCKMDMGAGNTLGGGGEGVGGGAEEARARRLARFGVVASSQPKPESESKPAEATVDEDVVMEPSESSADKVATAAAADTEPTDVEMKDAASSTPTEETKTTTTTPDVTSTTATDDPISKLSTEDINTLTTVMGFSLIRAQKGLLNSTTGVEGAVEWLLDHQDDDDIDAPVCTPVPTTTTSSSATTPAVAQSYKCNQCGKILSNMANLELHANKTGHSDFEESTDRVKPLTPEEKEAKIQEIKQLLKAKRDERLAVEKNESIDREKQRRFMGKEMSRTREEMEIEKRKRDAYLRKKEKEASKRERERIKREIEKDKLERRANRGKLTSKLGVDGYNPDAIQYDTNDGTDGDGGAAATSQPTPSPKPKANPAKLDDYIAKVSSYRAGGDGGKCLKILLAYVKNIVENPIEPKFRSINMENKVYRTKVKPFIGAKSLLLAIGFAPNDGGDALVLGGGENGDDAVNLEVLTMAREKLEAAYTAYSNK